MFAPGLQLMPINAVPNELQELLERVQSLPPIPAPTLAPTDPTKRPWQLSHTGYLDWAVKTNIERSGLLNEKDSRLMDMEVDVERTGKLGDMEAAMRVA